MSVDSEFTRKALSLAWMLLPWVLVIAWTCLRSEDRGQTLRRWLSTLVILVVSVWLIKPLVYTGEILPTIAGLFISGLCGFAVAVMWIDPIGAWLARMLISSIDGSMTPPEPTPVYSVARARQHQGRYAEAVLELQRQLRQFPCDFEARLLLAEVFAVNLKDLECAQAVIEEVCAQPGHTPSSIARALFAMADWHLAVAGDKVAARQCLARVLEILPNTEHSVTATLRITRLADYACREGAHSPAQTPASTFEHSRQVSQPASEVEESVSGEIVRCLEWLERYPSDYEARERLAVKYAGQLGRLDLAREQLEQMIAVPKQPARNVVRWLNLLADLEVRSGEDPATIEATLNRIIRCFPQHPASKLARSRIALLGLEIRGQKKSQTVRLGSYEQNIGLKRPLRHKL